MLYILFCQYFTEVVLPIGFCLMVDKINISITSGFVDSLEL